MPNEHPITPPPELVQRLRSEAPHGIRDAGVTRELHLITAAYRAGADQELEACCEWLDDDDDRTTLRAARRPKPPSLKEQGRQAIERISNSVVMATGGAELGVLNAIVESLPD